MAEATSSVTIRDVAREAQVSVASVSRALNGLESVTVETRNRIRTVADRMGYVPHAGARSLSLSRTNVIGVVLPDLHGGFFSELVRGMDRATAARGYQMLYSTMHADPDLARHAILAMHGRVDGLIMMAPQLSVDRLAALLPRTTPAVLINSVDVTDRDGFKVDNRGGAAAMVGHLLEAGSRHLVHIAGPVGNIDAQERAEGVAAAVAASARSIVVTTIEGDFQEESGAAAVRRLIAEGHRFDALFAANDGMALGALAALRDVGYAVPQDVMVAGFDDVPLARYVDLTTMHVPLDELGSRAVDRLIGRLADRLGDAERMEIVPRLIVRATTRGRA